MPRSRWLIQNELNSIFGGIVVVAASCALFGHFLDPRGLLLICYGFLFSVFMGFLGVRVYVALHLYVPFMLFLWLLFFLYVSFVLFCFAGGFFCLFF